MRFHCNPKYLLIFAVVFAIEIGLALFVRDRFVRPFVGDVLVVVLIYSFIRIFLNGDYRAIAFGTLIFACAIEILQYFDYVKMLGLENNRIMSVALGRTFELTDFAAYFVGFALILAAEKIYARY